MEEILQGDLAKFRGPLDLGKLQRRYDDVIPKGLKLRRGKAVDQGHKGRRIYTYIVDCGFVD
jgi:hypothetical protein